jgi:hypothetical protein
LSASPSKDISMPWKVTCWRPDAVQAAEREARRLIRGAQREVDDADAYLAELERFGAQTRDAVRARRRQATTDEEITVRRVERASMRDSPLAELFRSTGPT